MTIQELHSNEELRRHEFPVARSKVFLAHSSASPLPRRVAEALGDYLRQCSEGSQDIPDLESRLRQTRQWAAQLIGAPEEEIAFVGPTSLALSVAAA